MLEFNNPAPPEMLHTQFILPVDSNDDRRAGKTKHRVIPQVIKIFFDSDMVWRSGGLPLVYKTENMKRNEFISLLGLGIASISFMPLTRHLKKNKRIAVLCIGDAVPLLIDDYCLRKGIDCYYLNTNRKYVKPKGSNPVIIGKPITEGDIYEKIEQHIISPEMATDIAIDNINPISDFLEMLKNDRYCKDIILMAGLGGAADSAFTQMLALYAVSAKMNVHAVVSFPFRWESWHGVRMQQIAADYFLPISLLCGEDNVILFENDDIWINNPEMHVADVFKRSDELFLENLKKCIHKINS